MICLLKQYISTLFYRAQHDPKGRTTIVRNFQLWKQKKPNGKRFGPIWAGTWSTQKLQQHAWPNLL